MRCWWSASCRRAISDGGFRNLPLEAERLRDALREGACLPLVVESPARPASRPRSVDDREDIELDSLKAMPKATRLLAGEGAQDSLGNLREGVSVVQLKEHHFAP